MAKRIETPTQYLEAFIADPGMIKYLYVGLCSNMYEHFRKLEGGATADKFDEVFYNLVYEQYKTHYPIEGRSEIYYMDHNKYEGQWLEKRIQFAKTMLGKLKCHNKLTGDNL